MSQEIAISLLSSAEETTEARLLALVLDAVTSAHSRRSYRTGLERFFGWVRTSGTAGTAPAFTKALTGQYRTHLLDQGLSPASVNLRLSPIRRLAREMADDGLLDPAVAAAIGRVPGVERRGTRVGNWLTRVQANELVNAPDPATSGREALSGTKRLFGARSRATRARPGSASSHSTTSGVPAPSSAAGPEGIWSRSSCCSATPPSRPPSAISRPSRTSRVRE